MDWWLGTTWDLAAAVLYLFAWVGYGPVMARAGRRHSINTDMAAVRMRWMRHMSLRRDSRLIDGQLTGHLLSSASFFTQSNLILIAATAGVLFGGDRAYIALKGLPVVAHAPRLLFTLKIGLITVTLARSLLDFIWAIRQLNYMVALVGAAPDRADDVRLLRYGEICGSLMNTALSTFNSGVRGYYFALAAAAWVFGPAAFAAATVGAVGLLVYRQHFSDTARDVRLARAELEQDDAAGFHPADPVEVQAASTPTPMGQVTPVPPIPQ